MATNILTAKSPIPQFVCQSCGIGLQQDPSLDTLDDQLVKPNGNRILLTFSCSYFSIFKQF